MAKSYGGIITVKAPMHPNDDDSRIRRGYCIVFGRATNDAEQSVYELKRNGNVMRRVRVYIRYDTRKYMLTEAYGNGAAAETLASVEKGDTLLVVGRRKDVLYESKKRSGRVYAVRAEIVLPMGLVQFGLELFSSAEHIEMGLPRFLAALYRDPELRARAEKWDAENQKPDEWEI